MKEIFPNINPTVKGITLAFLATLGMANVYVFSKAALLEVNYYQFQFYWFGFALVWILPFLIITGMIKKIPRSKQGFKITLVIIGFLELGAASLLFLAIQLAENPTTISFLSNLTPIFVTILGIRFLGERFNVMEAIGIILTIAGVILITYTRDTSHPRVLWKRIRLDPGLLGLFLHQYRHGQKQDQGYSSRDSYPEQGGFSFCICPGSHDHQTGKLCRYPDAATLNMAIGSCWDLSLQAWPNILPCSILKPPGP